MLCYDVPGKHICLRVCAMRCPVLTRLCRYTLATQCPVLTRLGCYQVLSCYQASSTKPLRSVPCPLCAYAQLPTRAFALPYAQLGTVSVLASSTVLCDARY
eukprot:1699229-Rhodomonas_salina.1